MNSVLRGLRKGPGQAFEIGLHVMVRAASSQASGFANQPGMSALSCLPLGRH